MANKQRHWMEAVIERADAELNRSLEAMSREVMPPVLRRPTTRELLYSALNAGPETLPPMGRERLGDYLSQRYGAAAKLIFPYLGLGEDGREVVVDNAPNT